MVDNRELHKYERKITSIERMLSRSPFAIVTVVVRIIGNVSESMLRTAVSKVQLRHTNLRVRISEDSDHDLWFTSEGVGEISVEVVPRESEDHWIQVFHEASQIPFEFDKEPAIRFILIQSASKSELIILCHHIICDGLSLAFLARDLLVHLGDPTREVEVLPDPVPIDKGNIPSEVSLNAMVRFVINRINKKWEEDKIFFDQEDYRNINEAYWLNFNHQMLSVEWSEAQTAAFVARCREEEVTVNTALTTAFVGAQYIVQGETPQHSSIGIAGSLRDRLQRPAGEVMGFYAGVITLKFIYDGEMGFWENARRLHRQVKPRFTNKNLFKELLLWCHLEPAILESFHFKRLGGLVPSHFSRYSKMSAFGKRDDVTLSLLKRNKMDTLDETIMGTAVTNLTSMDFPRKYGSLELNRLIMNPGGAFPLATVNLVIGAVTAAEKLSVVVEYEEGTIDTETVEKVKDRAMEFLLTE